MDLIQVVAPGTDESEETKTKRVFAEGGTSGKEISLAFEPNFKE
jgi:hypothetical protein